MRESGQNFTDWDRLRGTAKYNSEMLLILHGTANSAGLFETDEAVEEYDGLKTTEDFLAFCRKWDKEKKINLETVISEAESLYEESESAPGGTPEKTDLAIDAILRQAGTPEEKIAELRANRKTAGTKPKIQ